MALKTYDPKKIVVIVGGAIITGFADGAFVRVERNNDTFSIASGSDGEVTRVKSNDKTGRITLTLQASSDSNDILSGFTALDELANAGVVPVLIKDVLGTSLATAARAWVVKPPAAEFGKEVGTREWVLETDELVWFVGGNSAN
jgi:hypothetical protein